MKTVQKAGSFFLALLLLFGTVAFSFPVLVNAASASDFVIAKGVLTKYNGTDEIVTIPQGVTAIGDNVFYQMPIKQVVLPKGLKSIGTSAFSRSKLTSVDIPEGVTSIGVGAFAYCSDLADIKFPKSLQSVGAGALNETLWYVSNPSPFIMAGDILYRYTDEDVSYIEIPKGVRVINDGAFSGLRAVNRIEIPNTVTTIKEEAFRFTGLLSVTIPDSVTVIERQAFSDCSNLKSITLSKNLRKIEDQLFYFCESLTKISIPAGVTSIGNSVLSYCIRLQEVNIPNTVVSIGNDLLTGCNSIKSILIPASVKTIGFHLTDVWALDPYNPDNRFIIWGYKGTAAEKYLEKYPGQYRFCLAGTEAPPVFNPDYNGHIYSSAVMMDTKTYTMAPGNIYDIGVTLLGNAASKTRRMTSSRDGIASVRQLPNGNYRVTALRPGTTYITLTIYNPKDGKTVITHASIKFVVTAGAKQHGVACRQTTYFN